MRAVLGLLGVLLNIAGVATCQAALFTYATADRPGANPDATVTPGGGSVDVWSVSLTSGDSSKNGDFHGNSAINGPTLPIPSGAGAGGNAWAMYANSGQTATSTASITPLTGLTVNHVGDYISLDFDNGSIDPGSKVGISFFDGSGNTQLTFQFVGGTANYQVLDHGGTLDTGKGFTANGFNVKLTLVDAIGGYQLNAGATTISSRTLQQATSSIGSIQVFNANAGSGAANDMFFNNVVISAVPEASPLLMLPVAAAAAGIVVLVGKRLRGIAKSGSGSFFG